MSLQLTVDIKDLYKRLCDRCKNELIHLVRLSPDDEMIRRALEGQLAPAPAQRKRRKKKS